MYEIKVQTVMDYKSRFSAVIPKQIIPAGDVVLKYPTRLDARFPTIKASGITFGNVNFSLSSKYKHGCTIVDATFYKSIINCPVSSVLALEQISFINTGIRNIYNHFHPIANWISSAKSASDNYIADNLSEDKLINFFEVVFDRFSNDTSVIKAENFKHVKKFFDAETQVFVQQCMMAHLVKRGWLLEEVLPFFEKAGSPLSDEEQDFYKTEIIGSSL